MSEENSIDTIGANPFLAAAVATPEPGNAPPAAKVPAVTDEIKAAPAKIKATPKQESDAPVNLIGSPETDKSKPKAKDPEKFENTSDMFRQARTYGLQKLKMSDKEIESAIAKATSLSCDLVEKVQEIDGEWRTVLVPTLDYVKIDVEDDEHFGAPGGMLQVYGSDPNLYYHYGNRQPTTIAELYEKGYRPVTNLPNSTRVYNTRKMEGSEKKVVCVGDLDLWACPREAVEHRQMREQQMRDRQHGDILGRPARDLESKLTDIGTSASGRKRIVVKPITDERLERMRQEGRFGEDAMDQLEEEGYVRYGDSRDDVPEVMGREDSIGAQLASAYAHAQMFAEEGRQPAQARGKSFFGQANYAPGQHERIFRRG